jgi:hypothetical protein
MTRDFTKLRAGVLICALLCDIAVCLAGEASGKIPKGLEGIWDPAKYISVDEVRPGMEAYCLTVYKGAEVEKFGLEVLSVVRNFMPNRDAILVRGTDERFIHTGPVAGCSGSPVYIDGRLAGALAFGWSFSKDPLYGVTPIADMLRISAGDLNEQSRAGGQRDSVGAGLLFDFSRPLDFSQVEKKIPMVFSSMRQDFAGATVLPSPIVVSGVPEAVKGDLDSLFGPLGFMVVSGGGGREVNDINLPSDRGKKLVPGACLAVPLVTGDITFDVIGTVTEVRGDEVYGFGHAFLGYGAVDLPMATGEVHTVVSSMMRSFKAATAGEIVGALTLDESTAVRGKIGAEARMIPMTISVSRYNDNQTRRYNCRVVDNRILTPLLLRAAVSSAVLMRGDLPPDNTLRYKGKVELDGAEPVYFENVSTGMGLGEVIRDSISPVALLMNNPYRQVGVKSFDFDVQINEKNITSAIWSAGLSRARIKAGEDVEVDVVTESFQSQKRKYTFNFVIPENTPAGTYQMLICGGYDYEDFLRKAVPHRFTSENLKTLVGAINDILAIGRDELHCILVLPAGGVVLENAELPELPATKALVLGDAKRAITMQAFPGWIEKSIRTGSVIVDKKIMSITVE